MKGDAPIDEKEWDDSPWGTYAPGGIVARAIRFLHALPATKRWYRIGLWLRKPFKGRVTPWVDLEVWGLRLRLRSKGNLSEQRLIFMPQFLDITERRALAEELKSGGVFLDIGANAGVYSLWVASLGLPSIRIEAFEPDPELCRALQFNLDTNSLDDVCLNQLALGRTEGFGTLVFGSGNKGENHIESEGSGSGEAVRMTTLPRFLADQKIARIDALKIDIEGYECDVLEPFFSEMPDMTWPRLLVCEVVHDEGNNLADLLARHGYRLVAQGRLNGIYRREP